MVGTRELALVTGASRGIGREIALALARRGCDLIVTGRDRPRLDLLAADVPGTVSARIVVADLSSIDGVRTLVSGLREMGGRLDILVNNAGFGDLSLFADADPGRQIEMIQVNVASLVALTRELLPEMVRRAHGRILNVASTAAFAPGPRMAVYYATKAFVLSFSEAIAVELAGSGVSVSTLCPGATATDFDRRAGTGAGPFPRRGMMEAHRVAEAAVEGMMRGKGLIVPGAANRLLVFLSRLAPRTAAARITYGVNRRK